MEEGAFSLYIKLATQRGLKAYYECPRSVILPREEHQNKPLLRCGFNIDTHRIVLY
jgi:hypothetical protein